MVRTKRCHLSFQFLGVVHDDTALIIGKSTVLMGKADHLFGHVHEFFHFWSYIHVALVHEGRMGFNSRNPQFTLLKWL